MDLPLSGRAVMAETEEERGGEGGMEGAPRPNTKAGEERRVCNAACRLSDLQGEGGDIFRGYPGVTNLLCPCPIKPLFFSQEGSSVPRPSLRAAWKPLWTNC